MGSAWRSHLARGMAALCPPKAAHYPRYSRPIWLLMLALDRLPWPWGEDILAGVFVAKACVGVSQLRRARAWAAHHPRGGWNLALSCCAYHGRFVARSALVGIRDPATLARHIVVKGEEHLAAAPGGRILLSFHLGPPAVAEALRSVGHQLTWVGGRNSSRALARERWQALQGADQTLTLPTRGTEARGRALYKARSRLLGGETILITADGPGGRVPSRSSFQAGRPSFDPDGSHFGGSRALPRCPCWRTRRAVTR